MKKSALLLAKDEHLKSFFQKSDLEEIEGLFDSFEILGSNTLDRNSQWEKIRSVDPSVILCSWPQHSFPKIPNPGLEYVCFLTGSVRLAFPRSYFDRGIRLTNWGGSISTSIAEMALLHILSCLRKANYNYELMKVKKAWDWGTPSASTLFNKRVGIHGFGRIARELIRLLSPFDVEISVHSKPVPDNVILEHGVQPVHSLTQLFAENSIVVELEALTEETRASVSWEHLSMLRQGGVFVNVGRGEVVEEQSLLAVAKQGEILIGLDVFHQEPLPADSPLRTLENVYLSPHSAGPTEDYRWRSGRLALENIKAFLKGDRFVDGEIDRSRFDLIT